MIYTVTFNPSLDYIVTVNDFRMGVVNRTSREILFPGGKGVNVSMVLKNLGCESTALGFAAGYLIPVAIFILLLIILRKQARENANIALKRTKRASKVAVKRLKSAAKFMKADDKPHFYEETMKALWGYLGDKLSIEQSELTKDNVSEKLMAKGIDEETIKEFLNTLADCEFARFSSVTDESLSMKSIYERASDLIGKLEDKL